MVAMDPLAGLEELGFTEVPDALASPLSEGPGSSSDDAPDCRGAASAGGGARHKGRHGGAGGDAGAGAGAASVYVSNVGYAVSRAALARLFSRCGDVKRVSVPLDAAGRCVPSGLLCCSCAVVFSCFGVAALIGGSSS